MRAASDLGVDIAQCAGRRFTSGEATPDNPLRPFLVQAVDKTTALLNEACPTLLTAILVLSSSGSSAVGKPRPRELADVELVVVHLIVRAKHRTA
jgi:hypothetical protein